MALEILKERRSIRKYEDKSIEKEKVNKLLQAALLSPSSVDSQPWRFIVIEEAEKLQELAKSKTGGSSFLADAALAIVVCADPDISDVWVEDASIAAFSIQLEAQSLGLGSCWIQIRNRRHDEETKSEDYVKEYLNIPEDIRVDSIISLGYPGEKKDSYTEDDADFAKVYQGKFGDKFN